MKRLRAILRAMLAGFGILCAMMLLTPAARAHGVDGNPRFRRLFIVPGMNHATGGDGASAIDYLAAIERWVVDGQAPAMLITAHVPEWSHGLQGMIAGLTAPGAGQTVTFTRPVYPYPLHTRFEGKGDIDDWRSFRPVNGATASKPFLP